MNLFFFFFWLIIHFINFDFQVLPQFTAIIPFPEALDTAVNDDFSDEGGPENGSQKDGVATEPRLSEGREEGAFRGRSAAAAVKF